MAIPVPNGLIHYSPCKSVRNILMGKTRSGKRLNTADKSAVVLALHKEQGE